MVYNQSYFTSVTLARKMLEQGNLDYEKQKQAVVYDVAQLYYLALLTSLQIELMNENLLKLDTLQNITKIHYEKSFLKKVDLDRIVVSKMNMASEISNMQVMLYQQLNMIKYFTGLNITDSLMLTETITDSECSTNKRK
jgi:outer membrane protein TolC